MFIITKVNNIDFKIAIECKDYNKPVSIEKIEAFNSKCSTVSGINKKIIVSALGFQSGAEENAKQFDIELMILSSVSKKSFDPDMDGDLVVSDILTHIQDYSVTLEDEMFGRVSLDRNVIENCVLIEDTLGFVRKPTLFLNDEIAKHIGQEAGILFYEEARKGGYRYGDEDAIIYHSFNLEILEPDRAYLITSTRKKRISSFSIDLKITQRIKEIIKESATKNYTDNVGRKQGELNSYDLSDGSKFNLYRDKNDPYETAIKITDEKISKMIMPVHIDGKGKVIRFIDGKPIT